MKTKPRKFALGDIIYYVDYPLSTYGHTLHYITGIDTDRYFIGKPDCDEPQNFLRFSDEVFFEVYSEAFRESEELTTT